MVQAGCGDEGGGDDGDWGPGHSGRLGSGLGDVAGQRKRGKFQRTVWGDFHYLTKPYFDQFHIKNIFQMMMIKLIVALADPWSSYFDSSESADRST